MIIMRIGSVGSRGGKMREQKTGAKSNEIVVAEDNAA